MPAARLLFFIASLILAATAQAQGLIPAVVEPSRGETSLTLDIGFGIRFVPPSRISVPVGETLRITGPDSGRLPVQWLKNGRAIPGATANPFVIPFVTSGDAGNYVVTVVDPLLLAVPSQALILGVGPTDRLLNLSTRSLVGPDADAALISGFVVAANNPGKKLILRAVGPALSAFGVTNPLRAPVLRIFDGNGKLYTAGYVYLGVIGGPTYESDLADSLARAGAFPLPAGSRDAVVMMPFVGGSYTAQVTSGDGTTGTVLLEIYEVP
ncbi:MAG: hypothetical protein ABIQ12_05945 [Opitutaceae bacterium]